MSLREAAQQALEALEALQGGCTDSDDGTVEAITVWCPEVITALRTALAEPEQEPVAWMCADEGLAQKGYSRFSRTKEGAWNIPVYTHPPQRKPLADKEIDSVTIEQWGEMKGYPLAAHRAFARAIERAHGIGGEA